MFYIVKTKTGSTNVWGSSEEDAIRRSMYDPHRVTEVKPTVSQSSEGYEKEKD